MTSFSAMKNEITFTRGSRTYFVKFSTDGISIKYGATIHRETDDSAESVSPNVKKVHFETAYARFTRFPVEAMLSENIQERIISLQTRHSYERFFNSKMFQEELIKLFCEFSIRRRGNELVSLKGKQMEQKYLSTVKEINRTTASQHKLLNTSKAGLAFMRACVQRQLEACTDRPSTRRFTQDCINNVIDPRSKMTDAEMSSLKKQPVHYAIYDDAENWVAENDIGSFNSGRHIHIAYQRTPNGKMLYGATIFKPNSRSDIYSYDEESHFDTALTRLEKYPVSAYLPMNYSYNTRSVSTGEIPVSDSKTWKKFRKCIAKYGVRRRGNTNTFIRTHEIVTWASQDKKELRRDLTNITQDWQIWNKVRSIERPSQMLLGTVNFC